MNDGAIVKKPEQLVFGSSDGAVEYASPLVLCHATKEDWERLWALLDKENSNG